MSRVAPMIAVTSFLALGLLGAAAPAVAAPVAPAAPTAALACDEGDDDDFRFESFDADYYLDVDDEGRSTLTTVETFVAQFPEIDQNRGMRRAIPLSYRDAPTDVELVSVTDGEGNPRPVETDTDDDFLLVTSAGSGCVHGAQTYVFTYEQHNVTRYYADDDNEQFYWDTNGTGWDQSFGSVTARIHVPTALAGSLDDTAACYRGPEGSTTPCAVLEMEEVDDGMVFTVSDTDLAPRENVTAAIGFETGTFVPRDESYLGSPLSYVQLLAVAGSVLTAIWAIRLRRTKLADGRGRATVVAEYAPPKGLDPFTAAVVLKKTPRAAAAAFIDLAVKRRIRIVETEKQGFFSSSKSYLLELVDPSGITEHELELARGLFGYQMLPGTGYQMSKTDTKLSEHVRGIIATATAAAHPYRKQRTAGLAVLPTLLAIITGVAAFVTGAVLLANAIGGPLPFLLFLPGIVCVVIVFASVFRQPLSDEGAELRDHLLGVELFIRVAEADRIRMLQSPEGAEREPVSTSDPRQMLDIYEKLLPYAVLFGLEQRWAIELGRYYQEASPDWYSGTTAFNAGVFASSISSMSTSAATSYSGSSSSSSSGGSGGGGSSGGGGGGGGGGGV